MIASVGFTNTGTDCEQQSSATTTCAPPTVIYYTITNCSDEQQNCEWDLDDFLPPICVPWSRIRDLEAREAGPRKAPWLEAAGQVSKCLYHGHMWPNARGPPV